MTAPLTSAGLCNRNAPHDTREQLFGGKGIVRVWELTGTPASPFTAVLACELEAGASIGTHVQEQYPEIVVAVSGSGSVRVNGVETAFGAGGVVELALGQTLSIDNEASAVPLSYLIIKAQG